MSANRSVQAAQRRRAGPPEPAAPGRGPQPSINSSQMFASNANSRMGPGSGQVSGRLAGQNAALAQKQMMEQQTQKMQSQSISSAAALGSINKMTLAQAITLITLRLGKVESQLINGGGNSLGDDDHILVDKNVIQSLITRIDALEKRPSTGTASSGSNQDILLLKQQIDTIKPLVVQTKNANTTLKQQVEDLKTELSEAKELITALQNLTMENINKILEMNNIFNADGHLAVDENYFDDDENNENDENDAIGENDLTLDYCDIESSGINGTSLKELIEQEFNA